MLKIVARIALTYTNINLGIVSDGAITPYSTLCTRIQAGYEVDELLVYYTEGGILHSIARFTVEHVVENHIVCEQLNVKDTQMLSEDTECQDSICGRLLG